MAMTDAQLKDALKNHRPITVGGLTFADINGLVRVDLPENKDIDAAMLTGREAEQLCCWLTFRFPCVREYIQRLQRGNSPINLDPRAEEFLTGPTLGERIALAVNTIRNSGHKKHNGDVSWLAAKLGVEPMTISRYFRDLAVPESDIATEIARILGWPQDHMACLIQAARIRQMVGKARKTKGTTCER